MNEKWSSFNGAMLMVSIKQISEIQKIVRTEMMTKL